MNRFAAEWLALREPADRVARDAALARRFAAALPRPARLADLGAGTGASARLLAPLIGGDQEWLLVDADSAMRTAQRTAMLEWAQRAGHRAQADDAGVTVVARARTWRFASVTLDLAGGWGSIEAAALDAVTCAAFLDLASAAWVGRLAAWLGARRLPLLAALTVDGRRIWDPPDAADDLLTAAFRRHQARDKGLGPALGGAAAGHAAQCLVAQRFDVAAAPSDWRLAADDRLLLEALIRGDAAAARAAEPDAAPAIDAWRDRRLGQAATATLGLTIGHRDLLALPA